MHMLAAHNRSEFLATPQLVRFDHSSTEPRTVLLIKASTLLLKYIVLGAPMTLGIARMGSRLIYSVKIRDDDEKPALLWSILERREEKEAIRALAQTQSCAVFLFNELAINVAWTEISIPIERDAQLLLAKVRTGPVDHSTLSAKATPILDQLHHQLKSTADISLTCLPRTTAWNSISNYFITNQASRSPLNLFDKDEGNQQEQISVWLTDNLHPQGAHHRPQIRKGTAIRELTDILLSYEFGSILIESKALTIFARDKLPNRSKLASDVSSHIQKAVKQIQGGIRLLQTGAAILGAAGTELSIERKKPAHGIVLIPDLDLIENPATYDITFMEGFMKATGGFLHLLDVSELLRIVQAAEMISARAKTTTPMMAFDFYLVERVKKAVAANTLCVEILLRFEEETSPARDM